MVLSTPLVEETIILSEVVPVFCKPVSASVTVPLVPIEVAFTRSPPNCTLFPVLVSPLSAVIVGAMLEDVMVFNCPVVGSATTNLSVAAPVTELISVT